MVISTAVQEREKRVRPFIEKHAATFGIDPNLVRALITQESRFEADATSPTGCFGYGQFSRIGAAQVQQIAQMHDVPNKDGLTDFTKAKANDPDVGIKAVCATLWWLFNKKYKPIQNEVVKLEAVLTFYNAGGKAAALVIERGGHSKAVEALKALPANQRSQSVTYAPEVASWFVQWHELLKETPAPAPAPETPILTKVKGIEFKAFVEAIKLLGQLDPAVDVIVTSREGLTEVSILLPGEFL